MENLVNSSPLILVLVFLVIGFVFLMKGADFFVEGSSYRKKAEGAANHHRSYYCGNGNISSGNRSQRYSVTGQ